MDDKFRGHAIERRKDGAYIYVDNGAEVAETWRDRPCGECGLPNTAEGYDGCIGEIAGAVNACCGHGDVDEAYIQYADGRWIGGMDAARAMREVVNA